MADVPEQLPQFVRVGSPDEERWRNALKVAGDTLGLPPEARETQQTARIIFHDRANFSD